ncbi:hypothetical protein ACFQS3_03680 [Glycomyces mayteni]|uniref:Uncharacterized protein n=1 Tax=Glycomyces mayteni TaxID=543887 RepID=A0ABW2D1W0_9ACTN|nr:hypothetical protein GCM10025732_50760 [Glycomyces mayteni]
MLDESEIQRRTTRPKRPTMAERYAEASTPAERDRFYTNDNRRSESRPRSNARAIPTGTVWITQPILKVRGWTDASIREFLPRPEDYRTNPHLPGLRPMPLWKAKTVAKAEANPEWQHWLRQSLNRRRTTRDDLLDAVVDQGFRSRAARAAAAIDAYGAHSG